MKALFVSVNAQYIHTGLGARTVKYYIESHSNLRPEFREFTINQREEDVLKALYFAEADIYLFSCYIWNIEMIKRIIKQLAQIKPGIKIFLAGPEATYKAELLMAEMPCLSGVILSEGEATTLDLLKTLEASGDISAVNGLYIKTGKTLPRAPISLDEIPFAYPDLPELKGKILYYESMRGCPFSCSYCISSVERGVRFKAMHLVFDDLQKFINAGIKQLKFVDRTFNCNIKRAKEIWQFIMDNDNGVTNFHFELAADLLDLETINFLSTAREGLFQFEIGVQSTNLKTLIAIDRITNLERLKRNVLKLQEPGNIHLHLDLIAGLPYENYESFVKSFHWVYALEPEQFQLGFLKVLGGSKMESDAEKFGIKYQANSPYQVLETSWLSYPQLVELEGVADMVDTYRNSGRYTSTTNYLIKQFSTPFEFFLKLWRHYSFIKGEGPLSKIGYYEILGSFAQEQGIPLTNQLKELCRFDIMLHEKPKKFPKWAVKVPTPEEKRWTKEFFQNPLNIGLYFPGYKKADPKRISRLAHVELFEHNPLNGENIPVALAFDYKSRDINGNAKVSLIREF